MGGYRLHLDCTGDGSPTVLLESGLGDNYLHWSLVQPGVSSFTRVCSYDRSGVGWSDSGPVARDSASMAIELHKLLERAGEKAPYVVVGHSSGAFQVRMFQALYPAEVAGMVMIDGMHPDQKKRATPGALRTMEKYRISYRRKQLLAHFGVLRLIRFCNLSTPELRAMECGPRSYAQAVRELDAYETGAAQVKRLGGVGDLPLEVVSEDAERFMSKDPLMVSAFNRMQDELTRLSTRGERTTAYGSDHQIPLKRPDEVVSAIRRTVEEARQVAK